MTVSTYAVPRLAAATAWNDMPPVQPRVARRALAGLPLMRAMMLGARASIACIHVAVDRRERHRSTIWRRRPDGAYDLLDGAADMTPGTLAEICGHLAGAAAEISRRWPERTRPTVVGFATDGHVLVFNPGHPTSEGCGWLRDHLEGRSPAGIVVHDGAPGFLTHLASGQEIH